MPDSASSNALQAPRNPVVDAIVARARWVVTVCVTVILVAGIWGAGVIPDLSLGGYSDPDSEAALVDAEVDAEFGRTAPDIAIVYTPTDGRSVDDIRDAVESNLAEIDRSLLAREPVTYWNVPPAFSQGLVSFDRTSVLAVLTFAGDEGTRVKSYLEIADARSLDGIDVQFGGFSAIIDAYNTEARADLIRAETLTFPVLLVLLLVIFGGVTAAAVPLCIGGLSILASLAVMRVLTQFTEVSVFATNIATLVSLGMAVDYSLFVLTRFREELRAGADAGDAVRRTMSTAGRTVAFSSLLLVCGFVGMLIFPQAMIRSLGFGGMAAVAAAAFVSLTALPATLALLGSRINSLSWRADAARRGDERAQRFWGSVAARVMRRPAVVAAALFAFLALLSAPLFGLTLGDLDHRGLPSDSPARVATDTLFADFPLANSGVTVVVRSTDGGPPDSRTVQQVATEIGQVDGIAAAAPGGSFDDVAVVRAILASPDRTAGALDAVAAVREIEPPAGTTIRIGGPTALSQDGISAIYDTVPWMFAIMIAATFVVTTVAFRSIVLSVKAIVMALVSLAATFGVLTWIFVDGHGADAVGIVPGPLQATMSILILAVVFGLSTDYEIFLLSRIVEAHDRGESTRDAVRIGAASTGRVVTAAALLLITVTAAFSLSELSMLRLLGIGVIVGLVLDATVVRMLLVPALVALMGEANWWLHPTKSKSDDERAREWSLRNEPKKAREWSLRNEPKKAREWSLRNEPKKAREWSLRDEPGGQVHIRLATTRDIPEMSAMMARAFQSDDPVSGYFFPDDRRRPRMQRRMMSALIRHRYLPVGGADVAVMDDKIVGVSLWHPHGARPGPWWRGLVAGPHLLWAMRSGVRAGIRMDRMLDVGAPDADAVLWVYLGVEPSLHRSGVGAALSRTIFDRVDREGRTIFGICKEGNIPFWTAMGFVESGTATIGPRGPLVHRMNRPPAPVASGS